MTKVVMDILEIENSNLKIEDKINQLEEAKNQLLSSIDEILDLYKGDDANLIVQKYKERVAKFDDIIFNYRVYNQFIKSISNAHSSNSSDLSKKINNSINQLTIK